MSSPRRTRMPWTSGSGGCYCVGAFCASWADAGPVPRRPGRPLDPAWDPVDILMFVNQLAMSWAGQAYMRLAGERGRAAFLSARRAVILAGGPPPVPRFRRLARSAGRGLLRSVTVVVLPPIVDGATAYAVPTAASQSSGERIHEGKCRCACSLAASRAGSSVASAERSRSGSEPEGTRSPPLARGAAGG